MAGQIDNDFFNLKHFYHQISLTVRFGDIDSLGHVNHTKYLTYMEQARVCYVKDICGWDGNFLRLGMILARASVDYLLPLHFNETIFVQTRCSRLGNKSFDLAYLITHEKAGEREVVATAITNMVAYEYASNQTISVPKEWREKILAFEPSLQIQSQNNDKRS